MERTLLLEFVRVTEAGAIASARLMGRDDAMAADQAAVEAMRRAMDQVHMDGTIVIGEGERDEAPMLYTGEKVGGALNTKGPHGPDEQIGNHGTRGKRGANAGNGGSDGSGSTGHTAQTAAGADVVRDEAVAILPPANGGNGERTEVDIAVDPLEGSLVARGQDGAISVLAVAERGGLLHAPDIYMEKLCVGPTAAGKVRMEFPVAANLHVIAESLGRRVEDLEHVPLPTPVALAHGSAGQAQHDHGQSGSAR
jgi:fructose-1,6-bisphosphatase/sedoheptulose 1,7-bisphosphatase-like protein